MAIEHVDITTGELHEPKGIVGATAGDSYIADGAGSGDWKPVAGTISQGFWDYNDLATTSSPIALTTPGTDYELTNDGAGADTTLGYALDGLTNVWDVATDRFTFTSGSVLALGDTLDFRLDIELTTTVLTQPSQWP